MYIYSDGRNICQWGERDDVEGKGVYINDLPVQLAEVFAVPGKYLAVHGEPEQWGTVEVEIEPSDSTRYPAQYVDTEGRHCQPYICKQFLKVLTGKTTINKPTKGCARFAYVGPME